MSQIILSKVIRLMLVFRMGECLGDLHDNHGARKLTASYALLIGGGEWVTLSM